MPGEVSAILSDDVTPQENHLAKQGEFKKLLEYLQKIPAMSASPMHWGRGGDSTWYVGFALDLAHPLAWSAVQELAYVVNGLSVTEALPTTFMPVAPPPYLNGPASEFLSWRIQSSDAGFSPDDLLGWLEGRLPQPVEDVAKWMPSFNWDGDVPFDD